MLQDGIFCHETKDTIYLVEVKAENEMNVLYVIEKENRGIQYCETVHVGAMQTGYTDTNLKIRYIQIFYRATR